MSQMNTPGQQPGGAAGRPGQMTAVMRAMAQAAGPKVLRIGLVHSGRIIEERVIKQRTTVTVGPSEKAMFVVPAPGLPSQFKLFELIGNDYYLNFLDSMTGRVALATGITDIAALRGQAKKVGNAYQVRLTEEARGKVIVGETTFLFQFVAPPPPQPRPQLPLAVKGGLASQIDWNLTVIAAFSFMLHFGLIGAMYSDWMDPVLNEDLGIAQLIDIQKNVPAPPVEEKTTDAKAEDAKAKQPEKEATKPAGGAQPKAGPAGPSRVSESKAAALSAQLDQLSVGLLGTKGAAGPAVAGVLNSSDTAALADLSAAARSGAGVTNASGLSLGTGGGGPVQPGRAGGGLAGIGGSTVGSGTGSGVGDASKGVQGPKADAQVGAVQSSAPVAGVEQTIAKLRPKFKACYQRGLSTDPSMAGKVNIIAKIGPNGEVSGTEVAANSGLSSDVVSCIQNAIKRADFSPPGGGGSSVNIPVSFVQQK